MLTDIYRLFNQ